MLRWLFVVTALTIATPSVAADCASIRDDRERLACYDAANRAPAPAAGAATQPTKPAPAPATPAAPAATPEPASDPEAEFGLSSGEKDKRRGASSTEMIRSRVTSVEPNRADKPSFRLENGQRWIQTVVSPAPAILVGDMVEIRRASMGSFLASVPGSGRAAVRVRRLE